MRIDWLNEENINRLDRKVAELSERLYKVDDAVRELQLQVRHLREERSRMSPLLGALSRMVVEKKVCSQGEFEEMMERAAADEVAEETDENSTEVKVFTYCKLCRHRNPAGSLKCLYCGGPLRAAGT